jgi:arylsulfatase A-like enzyme
MMVDSMVGRITERLEAKGMTDDTLLIFTSDNGPVWYDHDVERFDHDSCGTLRGMKGDAWEAGHRMPMIVRWPRVVPPNSRTDQMVCFTDFLATFADVIQQPIDQTERPNQNAQHFDSVSFLPVLKDPSLKSDQLRNQMVLTSGRGAFSVRDGDWKWIDRLGSSGFSKPAVVKPNPSGPTSQLYHLAEDLGESNNLATEKPDRVRKMAETLRTTQQKP